jgi:hypothetical protein
MDSAAISLYFDCPHNEGVALDVIARSALAWDGLIKELVSVVDPSLDIQVDFLSGTIASRSINSILRTAGIVALAHPWTSGSLAAVAGVFLLAPPSHIADDVTMHLAKEWLGHEDDALTNSDVERVARRVVELQRDNDAVRFKQQIFDAAGSDERVRGLGAAPQIGRPAASLIIPKARFDEYRSAPEVGADVVETRTVHSMNERVEIVRPYSKGEEKRWRFENERGEFSATMRDPIFLAALRAKHTGLDIGEGVQMWVDLKVKEDLVGNAWVPREYDVVRVVKPNVDLQSSFQLSPDKPDKPNQ